MATTYLSPRHAHPALVRPDWDGGPAIYFRIVFTDDSVKRYPLSELTHRIEDALIEDLALFTSEYSVYKRPSMGNSSGPSGTRRALGRSRAWRVGAGFIPVVNINGVLRSFSSTGTGR